MNLNQLKKTLIVDIETASIADSFDKLDQKQKDFWNKKKIRLNSTRIGEQIEQEPSETYADKAAIFAEFAKVVCISIGFFQVTEKEIESFRIKSFYSEDEGEILKAFSLLLHDHFYDRYNHSIAGHNIKEFDIPFLCRRILINRMSLPNLLRISGHKPWQTPHLIDTINLWKFGDYKNYTSLDQLCSVLEIPSPKDGMDGSQVSAAFWDGRLEEIKTYCEKDLVATARVLLRLLGNENLHDDQVVFVSD